MLKLDANNRRSIGGGLIVFRNLTACVLATLPFGFALLTPLKIRISVHSFFPIISTCQLLTIAITQKAIPFHLARILKSLDSLTVFPST